MYKAKGFIFINPSKSVYDVLSDAKYIIVKTSAVFLFSVWFPLLYMGAAVPVRGVKTGS